MKGLVGSRSVEKPRRKGNGHEARQKSNQEHVSAPEREHRELE